MTQDGCVPWPIAIDGPAASGKSSLGMALAERFGFLFLDTGLMYRAVTLAALEAGVPPEDEAAGAFARSLDIRAEAGTETRILVGGRDVTGRLREPEVEHHVSAYSALPSVRAAMVAAQRAIAARGPAILAGRDIGTVVLPDAPVKLFLEASPEARAARRSLQARQWGMAQEAAEARRDIEQRDRLDSSRAASPLRPAEDAVVIDTTDLSLEDVIRYALELLGCN
ncbi:(d)CMP kinase [Tepidiforma sp.]|uniref:(d)CMP kinase n=1 Tax=Tepidiforma sp. TaxID=2682230 RepID=UPI0021DEC462|nr:(d)CMP kinase [Tepidiforma sp.]MCX7617273.1 (d)CMP kinase [Tepidiforma sp.]GIW18657.1 MAG: cytidylate kinase [Tepidiforma sp.]